MGLSKFNHGVFDYNTANLEYVKLSTLFANYGADAKYTICAAWITHSDVYGDGAVIGLEECMVNLPRHLTGTIKAILSDDDAVNTIKSGNGQFIVYEYESHGKKCYSIKFI